MENQQTIKQARQKTRQPTFPQTTQPDVQKVRDLVVQKIIQPEKKIYIL